VEDPAVQPSKNNAAPTVVQAPDTTDGPTAQSAPLTRAARGPGGVRT
jgi:hypothetical protein